MADSHHNLKEQFAELERQLADPAITADPARLGQVAKAHQELAAKLATYQEAEQLRQQVADTKAALAAESDAAMKQLYDSELAELQAKLTAAEAKVQELERPRDPDDDKDVIIEIRAGAGGDESSLFAGELFAMYQRFAEDRGWKVELLSTSPSEVGGYKEVIFSVRGDGAFGQLKFEGGTHRVQRVPVTESGGRIHTSTVTVAVMPEAEEVDVEVKPEDLRIDVYRSSGPGGQSVNTTDSAVRITHVPTGLVVTSQDEKSQHKNKAKAMTVLRSRLKARYEEEAAAERGETRRGQIGTGDRSEKIRTYNFPQDRLTDHRIGFSRHGLDKVMTGDLQSVIEALHAAADRD